MKKKIDETRDEQSKQVCEKKTKFLVKFSVEDIKNACVTLVTKNRKFFHCSIATLLKSLQIFQGLELPITNCKNIINYVFKKYEKI